MWAPYFSRNGHITLRFQYYFTCSARGYFIQRWYSPETSILDLRPLPKTGTAWQLQQVDLRTSCRMFPLIRRFFLFRHLHIKLTRASISSSASTIDLALIFFLLLLSLFFSYKEGAIIASPYISFGVLQN